ncbi:hypothetical protein NA57DRAFT_76851 [Rhizodiscina lignyota]|uniref:F-box domain-containing protein n=1 Tax=Rhizodiscina lignyota TaxID=1504668 RepID=A0A9P4IC36_9PEZI|nr:hypothetical protein NA57DRAFT_76851 [Rhizodiscina lignyota]
MIYLSTLPSELIEAIALNLDTSSLCSLRLVNHVVGFAITKAFREKCFSSRTISLHDDSLIILRQILEHPLGVSFKHLTIRGGLIDEDRVAHEHHMIRYADRAMDLGVRIAEILDGPYQPDFAGMLATALERLQTTSRTLESLTVDAPGSDWAAYATRKVRDVIGNKAFFVTLDALARSGVKVTEFHVLSGVQQPLDFRDADRPVLEQVFAETKVLDFCVHPMGMVNEEYATIASFLQMFKSLEALGIRMALARRLGTHIHQVEGIRGPIMEEVSRMQLKKLIFGMDYVGYDMMHTFLERRGLHAQLGMLENNFSDRTDAFLQNSIWAQLESLELDDMERLSGHYVHGECCQAHIGADGDFKREFEAFHKHVAEVGVFGQGLY